MRIILSLVIFVLLAVPAQALDWQNLHNQADKLTLEQAAEAAKDGSSESAYVLALVYLNRHQDKQAGEIFVRLSQVDPGMVEAKWGKAEVLRRGHELKAAEALCQEALKESPGFFPATLTLGYIKFFQQDFKSSARMSQKIIKQGASSDTANLVRAYCLYAGSKGMLAYRGGLVAKIKDGMVVKGNLLRAQKLQPNNPAVLFGLGSFYFLSPPLVGGNKQAAEKYLQAAAAADPLFADVYVRLAQLYRSNGEQPKFEFYLNKAFQIDPGNELAVDEKTGKCDFICRP